MSILLADLFHATQKTYQLQLLAGTAGLNTAIDTLNSLGYETTARYLATVCSAPEIPARLTTQLRQVAPRCYCFRLGEACVTIFQSPDSAALTRPFWPPWRPTA
ncbi:MAG: hypothetical protein ABGU93_14640 [Acetobacterium sp.]|uniref:hypothetical protein n=1 Tax=Acetobacterium sp. TaxID=1872094 RepID=UPI003241D14E